MTTDTPLVQLVYVSSAVETFTVRQVAELLKQSRKRNGELGVTGLLLYKDGNILQILEGAPAVVARLFETIQRDGRHAGIIELYRKEITARDFPDWQMGFRDCSKAEAKELEGLEGLSRILDSAFDMRALHPSAATTLLRSFRQAIR